jgi:hypothetical protein
LLDVLRQEQQGRDDHSVHHDGHGHAIAPVDGGPNRLDVAVAIVEVEVHQGLTGLYRRSATAKAVALQTPI